MIFTLKSEQIGLDFFYFNSFNNLEPCYQILEKHEQDRATKLVNVNVKKQFIVSRAILRLHLSQQLNVKPESLQIEYEASGKPYLKNYTYHFNISHTQGAGLIAISPTNSLGVDIEYNQRRLAISQIAAEIFTESEQNYIANKQNSNVAFFECWTRKEAFIKVKGGSIFSELQKISVTDDNGLIINPYHDAQQWFIEDLKLATEYQAALASDKQISELKQLLPIKELF